MREGRLKLAKGDHYLRGSIEEQVELFRKAWPASELEADKISLLPDDPRIGSGLGIGMGLWFFMDDCPAGAVWCREDGTFPEEAEDPPPEDDKT